METKTTKMANIGFRTTPAIKQTLTELALMMGEQLGTKVSQSQAIEIAIKEAYNRRKGSA